MNKTVNIIDGSGSVDLVNGTYNVSASVNGYDNTSINPASINVVSDTNNYNFTIEATGTLTLHVTEDGTSSGTPVVGAVFIRTDEEGNEYGSEITTTENGDAVFNNVPYAESNAPIIYYKQKSSDGNHEFNSNVQNTTLTNSTLTVEIENTKAATRTISLTDENYTGLRVASGTLTITD